MYYLIDIVECFEKQLQEKNKYVVFWKENENWEGCDFCLENDIVLSLEDKFFLEKIKNKDPKAVVVAGKEYNPLHSINVDLVSSVVNFYHEHSFNIFIPAVMEENFDGRISDIAFFIKSTGGELNCKKEIGKIQDFFVTINNAENNITIGKKGTEINFTRYEAEMLSDALPKRKNKKEKSVDTKQEEKHITKEEIVKIMEKELQMLLELSKKSYHSYSQNEAKEKCMIAEQMLNIAKYLTFGQEW